MPIQPTYPGVYVEELPSGVHTITGVATSITAFLGETNRGPINKAVHIFSFSDYANAFGGITQGSALGYAVSQFFLNGGSEAWVVRLALNAGAASFDLLDKNNKPSLTVTAIDEGAEGNSIQVSVDDPTTDSTIGAGLFNLTFSYTSSANPADNRTEVFKGLSVDSSNARFVQSVVNGNSLLVTVAVDSSAKGPPAPTSVSGGTLTSGAFSKGDIDHLPSATQSALMIGFDGKAANVQVTLDTSNVPDPTQTDLAGQLKDMAARIQKAVRSTKAAIPAWGNFTCTVSSDNTKLILTSGTTGSSSSVMIGVASQNDIAKALHLDSGTTTTKGTDPTFLTKGKGDPFDMNSNPAVIFPTDGSRTGIYALDEVDLINLLCLPGVTDPGTINQAIAYCKPRRMFMIVDPPAGEQPDAMITYITGPNLPKGDDGTYAAIYYPWMQAPDPLNNGKLTSFPPSGMIAGLYAATDSARGVWKAPAGTSANLVNVQGLDYLLTNGQNGSLNQLGVNCLRIFPIYGAVCWGSRTLSGADAIGSDYKYVPVRRTALFLEESLYRGLQWVVFEPNDEPLWAQIRLNVGAFMHDLFRKGAFQGQTPKDAYLVKCDSETTTQTDINNGIVNILVGFAPLKPAEFVILQIEQLAGQIQV